MISFKSTELHSYGFSQVPACVQINFKKSGADRRISSVDRKELRQLDGVPLDKTFSD